MDQSDAAQLAAMPLAELLVKLKAERPDIVDEIEEEGRLEREQRQDSQIERLHEEISELREERAFLAGFEAGKQAKANDRPSLMDRIGNHTSNGTNGYHN